jgi:ligand-binding SRPBCC domain-containing protein
VSREQLFVTNTTLPLPIESVFAFFSDAANLARITPPSMGFRIVSPQPIDMHAGTLLDYRVRVLGVPLRWRSLISAWDPPRRFVDEQVHGPYRRWVHEHRFTPVAGGTRVDDRVAYELPRLPFASLALPLVRRQLAAIFRYRESALRAILLDEPER